VIGEENLITWLKAYGRAWETRDPESVAALFTEDATYQETPFTEPLRGRAAIREYWLKVVVERQKQIQFGFKVLAIQESLAFARWWCSFFSLPAGKRISLDGIFVLDFNDHGLCRELSEWWMRKEGGNPAPDGDAT
jgi:uncharacterized protein (TIGR02246 family)